MKIRSIKQVKDHMKDVNMKRLFRRNQIIITTLAVMIAAAGYLNYAGKQELAEGGVYEAGAMDISDEDILAENQAASLMEEDSLTGLFLRAMAVRVQKDPENPALAQAVRFGLAALENGEDLAP